MLRPSLPSSSAALAPLLLVLLLLVLLLLGACSAAPRFAGPLPVRNQHPAQLTVLHMDPAATRAPPAGEVRLRGDVAYSSLFLGGEGGGNSFEMDGEVLRTGLKAAVGLGQGVSAGVELPLLHTTGGFLDGFLIAWHDLFGLPDQNRDEAPRNLFSVRAEHQGVEAWAVEESGLELGDVPMALTWSFLPADEDGAFGAAVRAAVEWPTGDEDDGFGSGGVDTAVGVLGELRLGHVALTAHLQHTFAATPSSAAAAGLDFADVSSAGLQAEVAFANGLALLLQAEIETSTLRRLDFDRAADPQGILWLGARAELAPRLHLEVALGEDITPFVAPDITAYLGLALDLGGPLRPR